jgi:hypothetical protein
LKHHDRWLYWNPPRNFNMKFSDTDIKSDVTTSSSKKIQFWH